MQNADPFAGRLLPGETIVWRGRPQQGVFLSGSDAYLIPFSLLWGGFAMFWEASVLRSPKAAWPMALFGAPFVLIGLFLIFGRFFFDAWIRARVFYALTDRRILIVRTRPTASFQSVSLDRLPEATLRKTSRGRGAIRFGPTSSPWLGGNGGWISAMDPTPQFIAIERVREVFASVQERAQKAAARN